MEHLWIWASALAALCQALRYASLKELNQYLPAFVTSYARVLFAMPFLIVHVAAVVWYTGHPLPDVNAWFLICSAVTSVCQFLGTVLMMHLFRLGNFAVGTMIAKADAVMTALLGSVLLTERISGGGWIAILVTVTGVLMTSAARMPAGAWTSGGMSPAAALFGPSTRVGLLIALVNSIAYLALREAILSLKGSGGAALDAAFAGTVMNAMSCVFLGAWLMARDRSNLFRIRHHLGLSLFIGVASAFGTLLWFLAAALTNAAYVAAVTQVQIVFALIISRYWFRENIYPLELTGIAVILAGVLMFRFV